MDMFNHAMGSDFTANDVPSIDGGLTSVSSTGGEVGGAEGQAISPGGEGGCSESLHEDINDYQKM